MINKKDVYSNLKYVHWLPELLKIKEGKIVPPTNLQIDLTNICNHDCEFCYYHVHDLGNFVYKHTLPTDKVLGTLDDMVSMGGKSVEYTGGGEPLVHKDFDLISQYARNLGFEQSLVTNGQLMDRHVEEVLDYSWVRFSINGASKSYASTHKVKPEVLGKVVKNLEELAKKKKDTNMLGVSNIVYPKNWEDIYEVAKIAKESGADNYRISLSHTDEGDKPFLPIWGKILDEIDKAKELQTKDFRVFSFSNRIADIGRKTESSFCFYHHLTTALGADGELYPCCYFKYLPQFALGNIKEKPFIDVWFGEKRQAFIDSTAKDCAGACWMQDKNKLADYITTPKKDVPHINYP